MTSITYPTNFENRHHWQALLPGYMFERVASDCWYFGFLMVTGDIIAIESMLSVTKTDAGQVFVDAVVSDKVGSQWGEPHPWSEKIVSPSVGDRRQITINVAHVMAVFELAYT